METVNGSMVADSPDEVRVRVREQLLLGASQIKLTAGGGVASPHSPLDVSTFTEDELRAAVQAAENWGTDVAPVHAYTPIAMQRAIAAGVKVIEHGHLMDEASAKLMAEKGIWLSFQPFTHATCPTDGASQHASAYSRYGRVPNKPSLGEEIQDQDGVRNRHPVSAAGATRQGAELAKMHKWYSAPELLRMATSANADLLKLSGPRDPYPGKLGVVEEGALEICCW